MKYTISLIAKYEQDLRDIENKYDYRDTKTILREIIRDLKNMEELGEESFQYFYLIGGMDGISSSITNGRVDFKKRYEKFLSVLPIENNKFDNTICLSAACNNKRYKNQVVCKKCWDENIDENI